MTETANASEHSRVALQRLMLEADRLGASDLHLVAGERPTMDRITRGLSGGLPPLVGRENELAVLGERWARVRGGDGQVVTVAGDEGIGKSRLAKEFMHRVDGYADDVYWHQGRSPSYGDGIPMWSLIEMVRQRAGILEDEEPSRARTRLRTMLAEYVEDADDRQWIEPWLAGLLSVDLGYTPTGLLTIPIHLEGERYATRKGSDRAVHVTPQTDVFFDQALERARALPGVVSAAIATQLIAPAAASNQWTTEILS